jgi:hypothetical protein
MWKRSSVSQTMVWRSGLRDVAVGEGDLEVLVDRQVVQEVVALEDEADVLLLEVEPLLLVQPVDVCPRTGTSPVHAESCSPRMLSSVDLPEPDGPMIETKSPSPMSRVIPRRRIEGAPLERIDAVDVGELYHAIRMPISRWRWATE